MKVSPRQIAIDNSDDLYLLDTRGRVWVNLDGEWNEVQLPDDPGPVPNDISAGGALLNVPDPMPEIMTLRRERDELKHRNAGLTATLKTLQAQYDALCKINEENHDAYKLAKLDNAECRKHSEECSRHYRETLAAHADYRKRVQTVCNAAATVLEFFGNRFAGSVRQLRNLRAALEQVEAAEDSEPAEQQTDEPTV
jgi:hypothetical protein